MRKSTLKNLLSLFVVLGFAFSLNAQVVKYSESFEGAEIPTDWTQYAPAYGDNAFFIKTSYSQDGAQAIRKNGFTSGDALGEAWFIAPAHTVEAGDNLSLWYNYTQYMSDYTGTGYTGVWISTGSASPADGEFVEIQEFNPTDLGLIQKTWNNYTLDLSAYAGQTISIAFKYSAGAANYGHDVYFDNFVIEGPEAILADFPESFEDGVLPSTWTVHAPAWEPYTPVHFKTTYASDGTISVRKNAYEGASAGSSDDKDAWMITPAITTLAGGELSFSYLMTDVDDYAGNYMGVWVSTGTTDPADFVEVGEIDPATLGTVDGTWNTYNVDLSAYGGQTVYVALKYTSDQNTYFTSYVDNFELVEYELVSDFPESFEDGELPSTWTVHAPAWEPYSPVHFKTTYASDGTISVRKNSYEGASAGSSDDKDAWLITPAITTPAGGALSFSYLMKDVDDYAGNYMGVWVSTGSTDPADFVEVGEIDPSTLGTVDGTWYTYNVDLSAYGGQAVYVALKYTSDQNTYFTSYVDNFELVEYEVIPDFPESFEGGVLPSTWTVHAPAWDPYSPIHFKTTYASDGTISVRKNSYEGASAGSSDDKDAWMITPAIAVETGHKLTFDYLMDDSYDYAGNYMGVWVSVGSTDPADFVEVSELNPSVLGVVDGIWNSYSLDLSAYGGQTVYVALKYTSDQNTNFTSYVDNFDLKWSKPGLPIPYAEGFESGIPSEWITTDADVDGNNWIIMDFPDYKNNDAAEGVKAASSFKSTKSTGTNNWLISPQIRISDIYARLSFSASSQYLTGPDLQDDFKVLISTSGNYRPDFTIELDDVTDVTNWEEFNYLLSDYGIIEGDDIYVAIVHDSKDKGQVLYIDDFKVEVPASAAPSDISVANTTTTSTDLSWVENGAATSWNVKVSTVEIDPITESGDVYDGASSSNVLSISGLTVASYYYAYVQADVNAGFNESKWDGPFEFHTECETVTLYPYTQGFESEIPMCLKVLDEDGDNKSWESVTKATYSSVEPYEGSMFAFSSYDRSNGSNNWLISRKFKVNAELILDFYVTSTVNAADQLDDYKVLVSITGKETSDFTIVLDEVSKAPFQWVNKVYNLLENENISEGDEIYIAIVNNTAAYGGGGLAVDKFTIYERPISTDATLSDLTVDGTTVLDFDAATLEYTVELPYGTTTVPTVDYVLNDEHSIPVQTDATVLPGSTTIVVTAEDATTVVTYKVNFTLAPNYDASLAGLTVDGLLVEGFDAATLEYTVELPYGTTTVPTVTYELSDSNASAIQTDATALPGSTTVEVTAEDATTVVTYKVNYTITPASTDTKLSTLTVDNSVIEGFDPEVLNYDFILPYGTTLVPTVAYELNDPKATAKHKIAKAIPGSSTIEVTAEDGLATTIYTVNFILEAPSSDAGLSDLTVDGETVVGFDLYTFNYDVVLEDGTTNVPVVEYVLSDENATVQIVDATELPGTTTVTVTAQDGTTIVSYKVNFTVALGINDIFVDRNVNVYPNPSNGNFTLDLNLGTDVVTIEIINTQGQLIRVIENVDATSTNAINLNETSKGIYFLKISSENKSMIKKINIVN